MAGIMTSERFVVCVETGGYDASLEQWKIYRVVTDDDAQTHGQLRVVDESGEDYVYPARYFQAIDLPPALKDRYPSAASGRDTD